jgi:hypothetical protein
MNSNEKQRLKLNLKGVSILIFIFSIHYAWSQDTVSLSPKLNVFELIGGADFRINSIEKTTFRVANNTNTNMPDTIFYYEDQQRKSYYEGLFFRIQTSFIAMYFQEKFKKLHVGELVSVEASAGYSNSVLNNLKSNFQTFYNCELGLFAMYRFSANTDFWFSIAFFRFNRDFFADVMSGSNYLCKLRHKKWIGELSWVSENKMYFGEFNRITGGPNRTRIFVGLKYFIKPRKIIGVRFDLTPLNGEFIQAEGRQNLYSIKLFYGIHF